MQTLLSLDPNSRAGRCLRFGRLAIFALRLLLGGTAASELPSDEHGLEAPAAIMAAALRDAARALHCPWNSQ